MDVLHTLTPCVLHEHMSIAHIASFAAAAASLNGWGGWSASYYDLKLSQEIQIKVDVGQIRSDSNESSHWLRETNSGTNITRWTTSDLCPIARKIVSSMSDIKLPKPYVPGFKQPDLSIYPMDTARYSITIQAISSNKSPSVIEIRGMTTEEIATWYKNSTESLELCWTLEKPEFVPS